MARTSAAERDETPSERADRNLDELLGELRVALPGVQVLFAFLLIVPFNQRFPEVSPLQEKVYFGILLCTTLAAALLIAPSMHHRIEFQHGDKENIVKVANRLTIAGMTLLALAMTGVVVLVTNFVLGAVATAIAAGAVALAFVVLWYALPLRRRQKLRRESRDTDAHAEPA
jgi:O-antigen/teichoic acid export membrane protein